MVSRELFPPLRRILFTIWNFQDEINAMIYRWNTNYGSVRQYFDPKTFEEQTHCPSNSWLLALAIFTESDISIAHCAVLITNQVKMVNCCLGAWRNLSPDYIEVCASYCIGNQSTVPNCI